MRAAPNSYRGSNLRERETHTHTYTGGFSAKDDKASLSEIAFVGAALVSILM